MPLSCCDKSLRLDRKNLRATRCLFGRTTHFRAFDSANAAIFNYVLAPTSNPNRIFLASEKDPAFLESSASQTTSLLADPLSSGGKPSTLAHNKSLERKPAKCARPTKEKRRHLKEKRKNQNPLRKRFRARNAHTSALLPLLRGAPPANCFGLCVTVARLQKEPLRVRLPCEPRLHHDGPHASNLR
jgi:hypothetical protein